MGFSKVYEEKKRGEGGYYFIFVHVLGKNR